MENFENPDRSLNKDEVEKQLEEARAERDQLNAEAADGAIVDDKRARDLAAKIAQLEELLGSHL